MAKNLSEELHDTLNTVIKCVNYIKARPISQRLFSSLCDKMGPNHTGLLLHTKVRWLSRGYHVAGFSSEFLNCVKK